MISPKLINVQPLPEYRLQLQFTNGESGLLDMSPYLDFGVFSRLKDPTAFAQVHINFDTVGWICGVDLDPEFVYQKSRH